MSIQPSSSAGRGHRHGLPVWMNHYAAPPRQGTGWLAAARALRRVRVSAALAVLLLVFLYGCASLPPNTGRTSSHAIEDTGGTRLGQAVAVQTVANPGKNGIYPLPGGR